MLGLGLPIHMADMAVYLASDEAAITTGQIWSSIAARRFGRNARCNDSSYLPIFDSPFRIALAAAHYAESQPSPNICSLTCLRACARRLLLCWGRAPIFRALWSSRRAIRPMATWRPMRRWCLAKDAGKKPRELAEAIAERLRADDKVASVDVAGPGFINLTLKPHVWAEELRLVLEQGKEYGRSNIGKGEKVNVEYVSANPTGPMHVGHGRGAVFGDALANLLAFAGYNVTREYYINDAGAQVDVLARSAFLRYREALGENIGAIPEGLYPGDYLKPVGGELAAENGAKLSAMKEAEWLPIVRAKAIAMMMDEIRDDLAALNIHFDVFFSERSLIEGKRDEVGADHRRLAQERRGL